MGRKLWWIILFIRASWCCMYGNGTISWARNLPSACVLVPCPSFATFFYSLFFFFSSQSSMYFPPEQKTFIFTNVWLLSFLMYIFFSCKYSRPNIIILSVSTASAEGYIFPSHKRWTGYYRSCWSPCAGLIPCYCMSIKYSFFLKLIKPQF